MTQVAQSHWMQDLTTAYGPIRRNIAVDNPYLREHRSLLQRVVQLPILFPEIRNIYTRTVGDILEFYVIADFPDVSRENLFYEKEAELLLAAPFGTLSIMLLNLAYYDNSDITPPAESVLLQGVQFQAL